MAHPVPMLPPGRSASASETDRWVLHPSRLVLLEPQFTQQLSAIYNDAVSDTGEHYRPVEFRGNLVQHAADSEGGVSAYFVQVAQAADDMLKHKGLTGVGHVCLATTSVLSCLAVQQPQQQPSELPAALGTLALDAGAAAAAWLLWCALCQLVTAAPGAPSLQQRHATLDLLPLGPRVQLAPVHLPWGVPTLGPHRGAHLVLPGLQVQHPAATEAQIQLPLQTCLQQRLLQLLLLLLLVGGPAAGLTKPG